MSILPLPSPACIVEHRAWKGGPWERHSSWATKEQAFNMIRVCRQQAPELEWRIATPGGEGVTEPDPDATIIYPVGTKFWGPRRRYLCTVVDVLTTTNLAGEVVQRRYVATHTFCGQSVTDKSVCNVTIAKNFVSAPARSDATHP